VIRLILLNLQWLYAVDRYLTHLPTVRATSLWFDGDFYLHVLAKLVISLSSSSARLQIRCAGAQCTHFQLVNEENRYMTNPSITSFLFDSLSPKAFQVIFIRGAKLRFISPTISQSLNHLWTEHRRGKCQPTSFLTTNLIFIDEVPFFSNVP
jgi:hypothetical protein